MAKKSSKEVTCKIHKVYAVLSENEYSKKIFASISWNNGEPKDEIRNVRKGSDGKDVVMKGISLSPEEQDELITACKKLKKRRENSSDDDSIETAVDFDKIFHDAGDILKKRGTGAVTKDGFIKLERVDHK